MLQIVNLKLFWSLLALSTELEPNSADGAAEHAVEELTGKGV